MLFENNIKVRRNYVNKHNAAIVVNLIYIDPLLGQLFRNKDIRKRV